MGTELSHLEFDILKVIKAHHGEGRAITADDIADTLYWDCDYEAKPHKKSIQAVVTRIRNKGHVIMSTPAGYYVPATKADVDHGTAYLMGKALNGLVNS
jgi:hypothetical protein